MGEQPALLQPQCSAVLEETTAALISASVVLLPRW